MPKVFSPNFTQSAKKAANAAMNGNVWPVAVAMKRRKLAQIWSYAISATKKYFAPSGKRWKQMLWEIIGAIVLSKPKNTVVRI